MEGSVIEEVPASKVVIKEEVLNDDIKEFAETAMNELLGWYGYSNNHKESRVCRSHSGSNSSGQESPKLTGSCRWCGKAVEENSSLSSAAATFCSELCFSQSRRANFKKNKTCDWCRHVRHTVSYVDSQDGSSQLQFCSDKCLNQYKMHIFWRETRAHLELHPHLHGEESTSSTLITPDLWMTKCKTPDAQTSSPSPPRSPKPIENVQQMSPLPLISVAHPSKLMSKESLEGKKTRCKLQKKNKKKCSILPSFTNTKISHPDLPQDLRTRHTPTDFEGSRLEPDTSLSSRINALTSPTRFHADNQRFTQPHHYSNGEELTNRKLESLLPPPTILVPYPLILPLPIPIPIPIPLPVPGDRCNVDNKEVSSQTERLPEKQMDVIPDLNEQKEDAQEKVMSIRPLRKRKKVVERKTKLLIKNKKVISS